MTKSTTLFQQAQHFIPGGVNSPVRAFGGVGGEPIFFERGEGAYLIDVDGKRYIDYVGSWGPAILGHAYPAVVEAVERAAKDGLSFGAPTEAETQLAQTICALMPSIEKLRLVNSGTEATMTAIRLARGFTGRSKIIKFEGCYHGHADALLVKAGSGALTCGTPSSAGIPDSLVEHTLIADFNNAASVEALFAQHGPAIAAIIVEPVAGNMGCIPPEPDFLPALRTLCDQHGSLLICDEVMTGFRVALGGAQARYGITPDLTTLGKIIGGGLPVGALGGRAEIMDTLAPNGPVYQAGTLSGNPIAVAAGLATLQEITQPGFYESLEAKTTRLTQGILAHAKAAGVALTINQAGSMFSLFFTDKGRVISYPQVLQSHSELFRRLFHSMLRDGIYLAPSPFESLFVSQAHGDKEIDATLQAIKVALTNS